MTWTTTAAAVVHHALDRILEVEEWRSSEITVELEGVSVVDVDVCSNSVEDKVDEE